MIELLLFLLFSLSAVFFAVGLLAHRLLTELRKRDQERDDG